MNTIFMNFKNGKISNTHGLWLNLTNKTDLRRKDTALSNLSIYYAGKKIVI